MGPRWEILVRLLEKGQNFFFVESLHDLPALVQLREDHLGVNETQQLIGVQQDIVLVHLTLQTDSVQREAHGKLPELADRTSYSVTLFVFKLGASHKPSEQLNTNFISDSVTSVSGKCILENKLF